MSKGLSWLHGGTYRFGLELLLWRNGGLYSGLFCEVHARVFRNLPHTE